MKVIYAALSTTLFLLLASGCAEQPNTESPGTAETPDAVVSPDIGESPDPDVSSEAGSSLKLPDAPVELEFTPLKNEQTVTPAELVGYDHVVKEQPLAHGKVVFYVKPEDTEQAYADFVAGDRRFELGVVGGANSEPYKEMLSADTLTAYGRNLVRIVGVFGANAPVQNYYVIEEDGVAPFLRVDTGSAQEADLDGDGVLEIVATHGTPIQAYIYRYDNGAFSVAEANAALRADSVHLSDDGLFIAAQLGSDGSASYRYEHGKLIPVPPPTPTVESKNDERPGILLLPL